MKNEWQPYERYPLFPIAKTKEVEVKGGVYKCPCGLLHIDPDERRCVTCLGEGSLATEDRYDSKLERKGRRG